MTNEEAIARIKNHKIVNKMNEPEAVYIYISEALDMAIEALKPKTAHWIPTVVRGQNSYCCSHCFSECCYEPTAFCPDCGYEMVESEDV